MNNRKPGSVILAISLPLAAIIVITSCIGLLSTDFYASETPNWQAQSIGQDMVNLFLLVPCLIISSLLAYQNKPKAALIWGGVMLYLTYTFVIYCFNIHFNKLFLGYCVSLGLSFYGLLYFLFIHFTQSSFFSLDNKRISGFIGIYFLLISGLFYFLWLSEIIPAILNNTVPKSVIDTGLFTNGVQVIDLSVLLPAIFITGIFLLKRKSFGLVLAPMMLSFFVLMDITIGMLVVVMKMRGIESNWALTGIMGLLAFFSLLLLYWYLKNLKKPYRS